MSLITYNGILDLIERGVVENTSLDLVNGASLDIRLGESMLTESNTRCHPVHLARKAVPNMEPMPLVEGAWVLYPGQFALANTMEVFHLPNYLAFEYKLKSSLARAGLGHALAGWADPGWTDSTLTLELSNTLQHHPLVLRPGMKIGQVVFWFGEDVPGHASYAVKGRYNGQRAAVESKGV